MQLLRPPLSQEPIERVLRDLGLDYTRDTKSDFLIKITAEQWGNKELQLTCSILREERDVLMIRGTVVAMISQSRWPAALLVCNNFNTIAQYGCAVWQPLDTENVGFVYILSQLQLAEGVTEGFFRSFIEGSLDGAVGLFTMVHEAGLY